MTLGAGQEETRDNVSWNQINLKDKQLFYSRLNKINYTGQ
jgi:hypothetical protein